MPSGPIATRPRAAGQARGRLPWLPPGTRRASLRYTRMACGRGNLAPRARARLHGGGRGGEE
eukprot:5141214-Pyramimonas_sp.AAC.1